MSFDSEYLCEMNIDLGPGYQIPNISGGTRVIAPVTGGNFVGPKLSGKILPSGGDWLTIRPDGIVAIDVRITLQADDGSVIYVSYGGRIVVPPHLMATALNPETVESINSSDYYFRSTPTFETAIDSPHAWLNGKVTVGVGRLLKAGVKYAVYTVE